jgi:hypothetical protein
MQQESHHEPEALMLAKKLTSGRLDYENTLQPAAKQLRRLYAENQKLLLRLQEISETEQAIKNSLEKDTAFIEKELTDEQVTTLAHRKAYRYKHSTDPVQGSIYSFNRMCLIDFARSILEVAKSNQGKIHATRSNQLI